LEWDSKPRHLFRTILPAFSHPNSFFVLDPFFWVVEFAVGIGRIDLFPVFEHFEPTSIGLVALDVIFEPPEVAIGEDFRDLDSFRE
jgi:hypothetical protein